MSRPKQLRLDPAYVSLLTKIRNYQGATYESAVVEEAVRCLSEQLAAHFAYVGNYRALQSIVESLNEAVKSTGVVKEDVEIYRHNEEDGTVDRLENGDYTPVERVFPIKA